MIHSSPDRQCHKTYTSISPSHSITPAPLQGLFITRGGGGGGGAKQNIEKVGGGGGLNSVRQCIIFLGLNSLKGVNVPPQSTLPPLRTYLPSTTVSMVAVAQLPC